MPSSRFSLAAFAPGAQATMQVMAAAAAKLAARVFFKASITFLFLPISASSLRSRVHALGATRDVRARNIGQGFRLVQCTLSVRQKRANFTHIGVPTSARTLASLSLPVLGSMWRTATVSLFWLATRRKRPD